jgi:hypothetical protein
MNSVKLDPKKLYFVLVGTIAFLAILSTGGVVLSNNVLSQKNQKLTELKLENEVLARQKQDVATAKANLAKYDELNKIAEQIVPQDKDQAKTVREIVLFSQAAGINIKSISFPASSLGKAAAAPAKKPAEGEKPAASSAPAAPPISQVLPVAGLKDVYELEIVLTSGTDTATFQSLTDFLKDLESNRRTSQVSRMTITPNNKDRNRLTFTINFKVYIKP